MEYIIFLNNWHECSGKKYCSKTNEPTSWIKDISRKSRSWPEFLTLLIRPKILLPFSQQAVTDGRAIAQAVSRWLPTAAARVRARVWSSGICGGQSGAEAGFLRVLRFPLPILIPPISP
jgi:hypothetical protein